MKRKNKFWFLFLSVITLAGLGVISLMYITLLNIDTGLILKSDLVKNFVSKKMNDENDELFKALPTVLGYERPYTYLILFLNNTEMRPGGGFIGSYGVLRVDQGKMDIIKVEGTENLDRLTPASWSPVPPTVITNHLGVDKWYFRDSNWSPDYKVNAERALVFYKGEGGVEADNIDAVIAITPTVLEEFLKITGPIKVNGIEFNDQNLVEELEYEVEYGFKDKNIAVTERKQILEPFMMALLNRVKKFLITDYNDYINLLTKMADERHILLYSKDEKIEQIAEKNGWSGEIYQGEGDFIMWVDANLAALKTDHAILRNLSYEVLYEEETGRYLATVKMTYAHKGVFDWRTTRYRTYARVFVPLGAEFKSVEGSMLRDKGIEPGPVDYGVELNKQWFGAFISIEPKLVRDLSFSYYLPESVVLDIEKGAYKLYIQKQSGTIAHGLNLNIDFNKDIVGSGEVDANEKTKTIFEYSGDLRLDRIFTINLE